MPGLGLSDGDRRVVEDEVTLIIHAGAETGFTKSSSELAKTNHAGTENMLAFARELNRLRRFVYISTAYVSGQKKGLVTEEEPTAAQIESCAMLLSVLSSSFRVPLDVEHVVGHRDLAATACPGDALYTRIAEIIGKANWYHEQ